jgi:hypothetical protein
LRGCQACKGGEKLFAEISIFLLTNPFSFAIIAKLSAEKMFFADKSYLDNTGGKK